MSYLYRILAWTGWIWTLLVLIALPILLHRKQKRVLRGFDPIIPREEQD